jgi:hypothetical protein
LDSADIKIEPDCSIPETSPVSLFGENFKERSFSLTGWAVVGVFLLTVQLSYLILSTFKIKV